MKQWSIDFKSISLDNKVTILNILFDNNILEIFSEFRNEIEFRNKSDEFIKDCIMQNLDNEEFILPLIQNILDFYTDDNPMMCVENFKYEDYVKAFNYSKYSVGMALVYLWSRGRYSDSKEFYDSIKDKIQSLGNDMNISARNLLMIYVGALKVDDAYPESALSGCRGSLSSTELKKFYKLLGVHKGNKGERIKLDTSLLENKEFLSRIEDINSYGKDFVLRFILDFSIKFCRDEVSAIDYILYMLSGVCSTLLTVYDVVLQYNLMNVAQLDDVKCLKVALLGMIDRDILEEYISIENIDSEEYTLFTLIYSCYIYSLNYIEIKDRCMQSQRTEDIIYNYSEEKIKYLCIHYANCIVEGVNQGLIDEACADMILGFFSNNDNEEYLTIDTSYIFKDILTIAVDYLTHEEILNVLEILADDFNTVLLYIYDKISTNKGDNIYSNMVKGIISIIVDNVVYNTLSLYNVDRYKDLSVSKLVSSCDNIENKVNQLRVCISKIGTGVKGVGKNKVKFTLDEDLQSILNESYNMINKSLEEFKI